MFQGLVFGPEAQFQVKCSTRIEACVRTRSSVSKKVLMLDCLNLNSVSPTDSGKNTVSLTQKM